MSNESSTTNKPPKSREWEVIFYEDNERHNEELQEILKDRRVVGAYHDRDITDEGEPKKPHYHILIKFDNACTIGSVEKILPNHESNLMRSVKSFRGACRYLIHLDNPDKAQYQKESLVGNIKIAERYLQSEDIEAESVRKILTFIEDCDCVITDSSVLFWCCSEGLYSVYRRGSYMFSRIIDQHNKNVHKRWISELAQGAEEWSKE